MRSELLKLIWLRKKDSDIFLITVFCRIALSVFSEGAFRVKEPEKCSNHAENKGV